MDKKLLLTTLLLLASLFSTGSHAQRKTDVISMYNGDQITGEIKSLYGGILELSTDAMGTLRIEWPEIANVQSKYHYEIRLSDGERMYGSFAEDSRPGQVSLLDIYGRHDLEWLQVTEIRPVEDGFWERIDIYLSTTFSYTKATDLQQYALNTRISYEDEQTQNTLTARYDVTDTGGDDATSSRIDLNRQVWRGARSDSFRAVFANLENNDELELDYRIGAGAGIGRYFLDSHRTRLTGTAGLQVITERSQVEKVTNQDVETFFNVSFATWKFTTPELNLDLSFNLYPSLTDGGRVRSDTNLRLRWELVEDLYWDITAWSTTDNRAEDTSKETDYAITTGIGWEF